MPSWFEINSLRHSPANKVFIISQPKPVNKLQLINYKFDEYRRYLRSLVIHHSSKFISLH